MPDDHEQRECPLCGSAMRLKETEVVSQIPGNPKSTRRPHREWICPDCDNFEDADNGE
jgi:transposase